MSTTPHSTTTAQDDDVPTQDVPTQDLQEAATTATEGGASTEQARPEEVVDTADEPAPAVDESAEQSAEAGGEETLADADADADADAEGEGDSEGDKSDEGAPSATGSRDRTEDLVREGEIAADFLEALLDIADLAGDLEVDIEGNRAAVAIVDSEDGAAPRRLVGPGGSVLDALQELTRLAVQAETGERSRLMLDVAGYRSDRRAALVRTARRAIEEVRTSGAPRELEPMTAFERKVVHDEVLAAGLRSESEGTEPSRYVVIQPAS